MPTFKPLRYTNIVYKNQYVRYKRSRRTVTSINDKAEKFELVPGAVGYCYRVNGAAMYIALKENINQVPVKSAMFSTWKYHLVLFPHREQGWEVEG